jgi:hypothetical protein
MGGKVEKGHFLPLEGREIDALRQVDSCRLVEGHSALQHQLGEEQVGEDLADRADFENRVRSDGSGGALLQRAYCAEFRLAVDNARCGDADVALIARVVLQKCRDGVVGESGHGEQKTHHRQ